MSGEESAAPETPANPFDIPTTNAGYEPALAGKVQGLREKIKVMDLAQAEAVVAAVNKATQEKKSANETLGLIFDIVGKGVGLFL